MADRVLVTGGAGFIGSHLTESLLNDGYRVRVVDDESTGRTANLATFADHPRVEYVRASLNDPAVVRAAVDGCAAVYHLAAAVGVAFIAREPIATLERNIAPVQYLLSELSRRHSEGNRIRVFLASTSEVYGKNPRPIWNENEDLVFGATTCPRWSYGVSKAVDEFLGLAHFERHGLPVVIGRFFNVVGPRQTGAYGMVLPRFVDAAIRNAPLVVHDDGQQERCFAHVLDVVSAVRKLTQTEAAAGKVFNIGSDVPITILALARRVIEIAGSTSEIHFQEYAEAYNPTFEDVRRRVPDLTRIRATVGFQVQHSLDDIIAELLAQRRAATD